MTTPRPHVRLLPLLGILCLLAAAIAASAPSPALAAQGTNGWYWPVGTESFSMSGWLDARPGCWHLAQDMGASAGRPVYALSDGEVLEAKADARGYGPGGSAGGAIVILHKTSTGQEFKALYGHVREMKVAKGGRVRAGQVIAYVNGSSPNHLHFGINPGRAYPSDNNPFRGHTYVRGVYYGYVDPVAFLRSNLPWGAYVAPRLSPKALTATLAEETHPSIDGPRIAWIEGVGDARRIRVLDTRTGVKVSVPSTAGAASVSISGTRVVYSDDRDGDHDVYVYDLATGRESRVTSDTANQTEPAIHANNVVWQDDRHGQLEVYWTILGSRMELRLTDDAAAQGKPDIWRERVVWEDWRYGQSEVVVHDLLTRTTTRLTSNAAHQFDPSIDGSRVAWADSRNGRGDVYATDLGSRREHRVTCDAWAQYAPALSGGRLAWEDRRSTSSDIYIIDPCPSLSARACAVASGRSTVQGLLSNANGLPFRFARIVVDTSTDGGRTWRPTATAYTDAAGAWSCRIAVPCAVHYRARFAGDRTYSSVTTVPRSVSP